MNSHRFKIGPAVIAIETDAPFSLGPHPFYEPFRYQGSEPPHLTIRVRTDPTPDPGRLTLLGEFTNQWRLFDEGQRLRLEFYDQIKFQTKQVILIDPEWSHADFFPIPREDLPHLFRSGGSVAEVLTHFGPWWFTGWLALQKKGMVFHGSAVLFKNKGVAFIGPSGAGKTAIARLCRDTGEAVVLNDERILIWRSPLGWQVSGTPWTGMLFQVSPASIPLRYLCILNKANTNQFTPLPSLQLLTHLIPEAYLPFWSPERMKGLVDSVARLTEEVSGGALHFLNDPSIVDYLKELLEIPKRRTHPIFVKA